MVWFSIMIFRFCCFLFFLRWAHKSSLNITAEMTDRHKDDREICIQHATNSWEKEKEDRRRDEEDEIKKKDEIEFLNRNNTITQIRNFFFHFFVCPFGKKWKRIRTSSVAHFEHYNKEKQTNFYLSLFLFWEKVCFCVFVCWGSRKQQLANREGGRNEKENENNTTMIPFRRWVLWTLSKSSFNV